MHLGNLWLVKLLSWRSHLAAVVHHSPMSGPQSLIFILNVLIKEMAGILGNHNPKISNVSSKSPGRFAIITGMAFTLSFTISNTIWFAAMFVYLPTAVYRCNCTLTNILCLDTMLFWDCCRTICGISKQNCVLLGTVFVPFSVCSVWNHLVSLTWFLAWIVLVGIWSWHMFLLKQRIRMTLYCAGCS